MLQIDPCARAQLLDLLQNLPEMDIEESRRHLLEDAGLSQWAARMNLSGSPASAAREIVSHLLRRGRNDDWIAFLEIVQELVGSDKQLFLDKLIKFARSTPIEGNRNRGKFAVVRTIVAIGGVVAWAIVLFIAPYISARLVEAGFERFDKQDLNGARQRWEWAIELNPDNTVANYRLGLLYEDWQQYDLARKYYDRTLGEVPQAYNSLARLDIREQKYDKAIELLIRGLQQGGNDLPLKAKYSFYKNLGWAYFEQELYSDAERELQIAIAILDRISPEKWQYVKQKGAAYCLQAQAIEQKEDANSRQQSLSMWEKCCQLGSRGNPDERTWLGTAHERAKESEGKISCKAKSNLKP